MVDTNGWNIKFFHLKTILNNLNDTCTISIFTERQYCDFPFVNRENLIWLSSVDYRLYSGFRHEYHAKGVSTEIKRSHWYFHILSTCTIKIVYMKVSQVMFMTEHPLITSQKLYRWALNILASLSDVDCAWISAIGILIRKIGQYSVSKVFRKYTRHLVAF